MAFIETYISTVAGGSELANFWDEAVELSTTIHELIIKESYDWTNEALDAFIQSPLPVQPTTGRFPSSVRELQALKAINRANLYLFGSGSEITIASRDAADEALKRLLEGRAQIEAMYSQDEIGFNYPVAGSTNTSTALLQVDRQASFTGDTERTYTITATSSAAIGTATFSWSDGEGTTSTGHTSDYDWIAIDSGLNIRWFASPSGGVAIVSGNTWKIRCVPETVKADAPGATIGSISLRN